VSHGHEGELAQLREVSVLNNIETFEFNYMGSVLLAAYFMLVSCLLILQP
jgi:hypothetical protein